MKLNDSEYVHRPQVSRRTILKGLGASLTLPFLPSLAWAQAKEVPILGVDVPPRRWATLIFANGVNPKDWWVKGEGAAMELSRPLKPLEKFKQELLFMDNLHLFDDTVGVHSPYFTNFLSGEKIRKGNVPQVAETIDNYLGRSIGKNTPVPNITLGIEGGGGMNGVLTWSSKTTPVPPEVFPRQAFDRLFDVSGLMRDQSVLDFVKDQAKSVQGKLAYEDKAKMEEYLTAIREIEKRIELATAEDRFTDWRPSIEEPNMDRPQAGIPNDPEEHMKLMLDIIVLAFQMDQTRIASMLFEKDVTGMRFNFIDGVSNTGMHGISHHRRLPKMLEEYTRINEYHVKLLAYVMDKMSNIKESDGSTLLDNTILLFGSTMRDGDPHDANDLPLILAGGKNCDLRTGGRHIRYEKLDDRRLCNLHLALAQRVGGTEPDGSPIKQFGNSHYPLPGLT